jgi:ribosome-binding protein aMBF1 (putative translation factor)
MDSEERPSERLERNWEYQQLVKNYPEIIQAAARDDGLDIS